MVPLGIRLAQKVVKSDEDIKCENLFNKMFYDPVIGINKINIDGKILSAVMIGNHTGTQTVTKADGEHTDCDLSMDRNSSLFSTKTITEVRAEATDQDFSGQMGFGTLTNTRVQAESTDHDPMLGA